MLSTTLGRVSLLLPLCAALGCASAGNKQPKHGAAASNLHHASATALSGPDAPPIPAFLVGAIDGDASPIAMARRGSEGVAVLDRGGHLWAQRFNAKSGLDGPPIDLGSHAPLAQGGLTIEAAHDGYGVVWDELIDQNHDFKALALDAAGKPLGPALSLAPLAERVSLVGLVPAGDGFLVIHELQKDGASDVFATPIDGAMKHVVSGAQLVVKGALGWNAIRNDKEVVFACVMGPSPANDQGEVLGRVETFGVDASGKKGAITTVLDRAVADIDVEIASVEGTILVAWTDHTDSEAAVRFATVRAGKVMVPPKRASSPLGEQALMGLVADVKGGSKRALLAWENVGEASGEARHVEVATVGADGSVSPERATFLLDAQGRPDVVADGDGFALLTLASASIAQNEEASRAAAPVWPSYVRLGADLAVHAAEPVRFIGTKSREGIPDLTQSLSCEAGDCTLLAASAGSPTNVYMATLLPRSSPWRPVAWRSDGAKPPLVREVRTVWEGQSLSQVAALKLTGATSPTLITWITYFVNGTTDVEPAPRGEPPFAANFGVRAIHEDGTMGEPVVLSKRALSEGGVAIAAAPPKTKPDAIIAWVANEKSGPQVYVTKVDADGKKTAQKKLTTVTRSKGSGKNAGPTTNASSVAIAYAAPTTASSKRIHFSAKPGDEKPTREPVAKQRKTGSDKPKKSSGDKPAKAPSGGSGDASSGGDKSGKPSDGFIVGWVDTRDKNGEVYVARINRELDKVVVDKRITNADGDASDVNVLVHGSDTFVAYSDARGEEQGDIYIAHLDTQTLGVIDSEGRVYASGTHSRSPKLSSAGDHIMLGWIEEGAEAETGARGKATLRLAELDSMGTLVTTPTILDAPGSVTSFELTCSGATFSTCRGVITTEQDGQVTLSGFTLGDDGKPSIPQRLYHLSTAALTDVSPSFNDSQASSVLLLEEAGRGRARLMGLDWK